MKKDKVRWKAIEITLKDWRKIVKEVGLWEIIWGTDIFIQKIPVIKSMILANLLMWVLLWVSR